jgi:hypothetical protein
MPEAGTCARDHNSKLLVRYPLSTVARSSHRRVAKKQSRPSVARSAEAALARIYAFSTAIYLSTHHLSSTVHISPPIRLIAFVNDPTYYIHTHTRTARHGRPKTVQEDAFGSAHLATELIVIPFCMHLIFVLLTLSNNQVASKKMDARSSPSNNLLLGVGGFYSLGLERSGQTRGHHKSCV